MPSAADGRLEQKMTTASHPGRTIFAAAAKMWMPTQLHDLAESAPTPGRALPSRSSNEAPPPVLQCVTLSSVPSFLQAVAVSPPPITVTVPLAVAATTASINVFVPASNLAISNTPIGPFQIIVLDSATAFALSLLDSSPQSKPINPSGTPSAFVPVLISPSSPNFDDKTKSTAH